MIGHPAWDFIHPEDVDAAAERLGSAVDRIDSVNPIAVRASHVDGSWVSVEIAGGSMRDANGGIGGLIINIRDIRWRNDALDALRTSEQLFRTLAQSSPIGIYHATVDERPRLRERPVVRDHRRVRRGCAAGSGWAKMIHPDDSRLVGLDRGSDAHGRPARHHRVPRRATRRRGPLGAGAERTACTRPTDSSWAAWARSTTSPTVGTPSANDSG